MKKVIDSRVFGGVVVELKLSDSAANAERGRQWYAVIGGNVHYPSKESGVTNEQEARAWLNSLCRKQGLLKR